jgi:hypothetical protein
MNMVSNDLDGFIFTGVEIYEDTFLWFIYTQD